MVGLKSNTMGMNIAIQAEASHFSYIPCSICGLRNLSRNKRKAEGINLEEAAACQLLTNNWIHIWKEVKPAVCALESVSKLLPNFPYFCHGWGKPTLFLGVYVTYSQIVLVKIAWFTTG